MEPQTIPGRHPQGLAGGAERHGAAGRGEKTAVKPTQRNKALVMNMFAPEGAVLPSWVGKAISRKHSKAKPKQEETILQKQCCDYLKLKRGLLYFSIPNHIWMGQGDPGKQAAYIAKQKSMGLLPGVSDLCIIGRNKHGASVTCFAELKSQSGNASESQLAFMEKANNIGCYTSVVRNLNDMIALLSTAGF